MKTLLKLEELAMFLLVTISLVIYTDSQWWIWLLLLVGPDISMLGYLVNNKVGAYCYNFFHHKGIAITIFLFGFILIKSGYQIEISGQTYNVHALVALVGAILFGHSSMDRFFAFGLKTEEGFKFTHLGKIGKDEPLQNL